MMGAAGAQAEMKMRRDTLILHTASGDHRINIEVAESDREKSYGLMFRRSLGDDEGMLFPYPTAHEITMWMRNTFISLDMIFIRADGSIDRIAENTIPESLDPVVSGGDVAAVLELAGGTAAKLGLDEDATVSWKDR